MYQFVSESALEYRRRRSQPDDLLFAFLQHVCPAPEPDPREVELCENAAQLGVTHRTILGVFQGRELVYAKNLYCMPADRDRLDRRVESIAGFLRKSYPENMGYHHIVYPEVLVDD